ncbi:HprK-related kinase A [Kordiimonas sp. SCSIO 12610]|uniref:HprK-related kinase A n=1 Tax=Kordiimonas sp. SCSIO 12610 TaxID=2829597 RepID=UPI00210B1894|nr:HprK-related kinase A [Kordiimonas sp. SCSIO 12610]UTW54141.1 HprK-related kinase A [Kordiimonas sp. SCSIO 12610]
MNSHEIKEHIKKGELLLHIGDFSARLKAQSSIVLDHLHDMYRDYKFADHGSQLHDHYLDIRAPNVLRGLIKQQIVPDPGFQFPAVPLPEKMAALAFEMGLNISVALRTYRYLILHAGVVANSKGSVIISAASGGGKSTLTSLLMEKGFRLLSDEFGIVDLETVKLRPYPRPVSLKNESIEVVREIAGDDWISDIIKDGPKGDVAYRRARPNDIENSNIHASAKLVLFPKFEKGAVATLTKVKNADTVMRLLASSTNYQVIGEKAFTALNDLSSTAEAYEMVYGSSEDALRLFGEISTDMGL